MKKNPDTLGQRMIEHNLKWSDWAVRRLLTLKRIEQIGDPAETVLAIPPKN